VKELDAAWRELQPWLEQLEVERTDKLRRFWRSLPLAIGAAILVGGGSAFVDAPGQISAIMGVIVAGLVISWGFGPLISLKERLKIGLNQRLAESFGLSYRQEPAAPAQFDSFRAHGLIPTHDRRSFEDHFSGEAHGAHFELYEAELKQRRRSKNRTYYVTVFHGALIRIRFPRTIEGVTLITRDKGWFNALEGWSTKTFGRAGRKLERIGLVDPKFEKLFEVYGTDQVMARYLLTPSFMERLLELETLLKGKNVRCVFDESLADGDGEGELLIAAETGNLFEAGSIFAPADQRERVETLFKEIKLIDDTIATVLEPATER
jgi:hypothetical protein